MTCYLIDLDGTLLVDGHAVDGAAEFIRELNRRKAEYLLLTNGSANAPKTIKSRLKAEGMEIEQRRILTSAEVAAIYLKEFLPDKSVCCIGSVWLEQCLKKEGIRLDEERAEIVLIGYDERISMASLNQAIDLIMDGAIYLSTNDDLWIPTGVAVKPHTGYINGMIYQATGKKPIIIGKPEQYFWKLIMQRTQAKTFCMIGDSMQTDAAFGLGNHMKVYLVKSRMADREREKDDLMIQKVKNLKEVIRYLST